MTQTDTYQALATLLEYPQQREALVASVDRVSRHLDRYGMRAAVAPFAEFVAGSTLAELQEDYVADFDFNPARAPYLGHHLYGDNQKKATYLIMLKKEFARFGFSPDGCELPDHLSVLVGFLAHLARNREEEPRRRFIEEAVLPGMEKLLSAPQWGRSRWLPLFQATEGILNRDCKEGAACSTT